MAKRSHGKRRSIGKCKTLAAQKKKNEKDGNEQIAPTCYGEHSQYNPHRTLTGQRYFNDLLAGTIFQQKTVYLAGADQSHGDQRKDPSILFLRYVKDTHEHRRRTADIRIQTSGR